MTAAPRKTKAERQASSAQAAKYITAWKLGTALERGAKITPISAEGESVFTFLLDTQERILPLFEIGKATTSWGRNAVTEFAGHWIDKDGLNVGNEGLLGVRFIITTLKINSLYLTA